MNSFWLTRYNRQIWNRFPCDLNGVWHTVWMWSVNVWCELLLTISNETVCFKCTSFALHLRMNYACHFAANMCFVLFKQFVAHVTTPRLIVVRFFTQFLNSIHSSLQVSIDHSLNHLNFCYNLNPNVLEHQITIKPKYFLMEALICLLFVANNFFDFVTLNQFFSVLFRVAN